MERVADAEFQIGAHTDLDLEEQTAALLRADEDVECSLGVGIVVIIMNIQGRTGAGVEVPRLL